MPLDSEIASPVTEVAAHGFESEDAAPGPADGVALCLSGGGFRAMLYHAGALIRLNELGALANLSRVSSVSGGSITAGVLALHWNELVWDSAKSQVQNLDERVVAPLRDMARQSIDVSSVGWGSFNPFRTISDEVSAAYDKHLFGGASLQALPDENLTSAPKVPRFTFNATNVKTGSLWRFAKAYMADYRVGMVERPDVPLATAVTASSAFPPFLSPLRLNLDRFTFVAGIPKNEVARSLRSEAVLTDGGVYDNLGLESVWKRFKTVLVSDGGRPSEDDLQPADDWARHSRRLIDLLQGQIGALRTRQIVAAFQNQDDVHDGALWGIGSDPAKFPAAGSLDCSREKTAPIASIATRLAALSNVDQERIINWGYAACDLAMRSHVERYKASPAPRQFPFPGTALG